MTTPIEAHLIVEWRAESIVDVDHLVDCATTSDRYGGRQTEEIHYLAIVLADPSNPLIEIGFQDQPKSADRWRARILAARACHKRSHPMVERHVIREHVREQVLIRCRYCDSANLPHAERCHNCGAARG